MSYYYSDDEDYYNTSPYHIMNYPEHQPSPRNPWYWECCRCARWNPNPFNRVDLCTNRQCGHRFNKRCCKEGCEDMLERCVYRLRQGKMMAVEIKN